MAAPGDKLAYYVAEKQSNSRGVIEEFWQSQKIDYEIRMVPEMQHAAQPL